MPAIETGGAKTRRVKRKPPPQPKPPTPDQADRNKAAQRPPTPDQADRNRSPQQQAKDKAAVAKSVRESRVKALRKQNRGSGTRAVKKAVQTVIHTNAPATVTTPAVDVKNRKVHAIKVGKDIEPARRKESLAPAISVLDQTTRPLHGVANAAKANVHAIKTEGLKPRPFYLQASPKKSLKAAARGVQNKDKTTFSDVLTEAGWRPKNRLGKIGKGVAGFTGDVAFDPTTYVTGGTGGVAVKAGEKAASKAAEKAAAKGLTEAQITRMGERARKAAEKKAGSDRGIVVRVAGTELPGVTKATAKAAKPVKKVARKVTPRSARQGVRDLAADVNPDVVPVGASKETSEAAVEATRTARSEIHRGVHVAHQEAKGIHRVIGDENYSKVIDAIEKEGVPAKEVKKAVKARTVEARKRSAKRAEEAKAAREESKAAREKAKAEPTPENKAAAKTARGKSKKARERAVKARADKKETVRKETTLVVNKKSKTAAKAQRRAIAALPPELRQHAVELRGQMRHMYKEEKQAGVPISERKGYIPHNLSEETKAERGITKPGQVGRRVIEPASSKKRKDERSLAQLRVEEPGKYSENLPQIFSNRKIMSRTAAARANLNRRLAELGQDVRPHKPVAYNPETEGIYHIHGASISPKPLSEVEVKRVLAGKSHDKGKRLRGRYVVLNNEVVKRSIEGSMPTMQGPGFVRLGDKVQGGFKRIALATPGFHVRNFVGDTHNAYLGQPGHHVPANMKDAIRIVKAEGRREQSLRKFQRPVEGAAGINTPRYGHVSYEKAADMLARHGGMRSGYTSRELPELSKGMLTSHTDRLKRYLQNREDIPRLTSAVEVLKNGGTWEKAAAKVAHQHFDYGHLTNFERQVMRRAFPFYTFTARNIPLQAKTLIQKPGKFANYQKLKEEVQKSSDPNKEYEQVKAFVEQLKAAGVDLPKDRWESLLTQYEQRTLSIPVRYKGHVFTVSMGLPIQDLNEFPGASLDKQITDYYQRGMSMASPLPKDILEYMENHSFFFRDEISRQNAPLVPAPVWVKALPPGLKRQMHVTPNYQDKKTGKSGWGYSAKADYIVKSIPGTPQFVEKMLTPGADRAGKSAKGKLLAWAGVKATPYDPLHQLVNLAYARKTQIEKQRNELSQQINPANGEKISAKNPTPEYTKLNKQYNILLKIAYGGKQAQGYKVMPKQGGPSKGRSTSDKITLGTGTGGGDQVTLGGGGSDGGDVVTLGG